MKVEITLQGKSTCTRLPIAGVIMRRKVKKKDLPPLEAAPDRNVFVMMRYRDTDPFQRIEELIRNTLYKAGLYARFAKDLPKAEWLWANICKYLDACKYGIAVFDALPTERREPKLNPNVCIELGYMLAKAKKCLILKDEKLTLQTDLHGFVFKPFNGHQLDTLRQRVQEWTEDHVPMNPLFEGFASLVPGTKIAKRLREHVEPKLSVGRFLAEEYLPNIPNLKGIILDSGTSAAAVAESLFLNREKYTGLTVYTNNLLASVILCSAAQFVCKIVPGVVDEDFGGVFGLAACSAIKTWKADVTILACTGFTAEEGPYANSKENRDFKESIIDQSSETILITTSERLGKPMGKPVLASVRAWQKVLSENVSMVVTCPRLKTPEFTALERKLKGKLRVLDR